MQGLIFTENLYIANIAIKSDLIKAKIKVVHRMNNKVIKDQMNEISKAETSTEEIKIQLLNQEEMVGF